ncbi:MAG: M20/M25/M40 family metallo-hydrolase [Acidobacteria bacterium]|nr:M20/M25/M40 family metallo-hydrolase [Acidobacteriota bacterium]
MFRLFLVGAVAVLGANSPAERQLLDSIQATALKGHVSFLASDLLEGRDTPSRGIEIAEEYIAAQFRRIGLEPGGDSGSYFQSAAFLKVTQPMEGFRVSVEGPDGKSWGSTGGKVSVTADSAIQADNLKVMKVTIAEGDGALPARELVQGKAVLVYLAQRTRTTVQRLSALLAMKPALVVTTGPSLNRPFRLREADGATGTPMITTSDGDFVTFAAGLPDGETPAVLSVNIAAPVEEKVTLRNVIAVLPGSDATLRNQRILLTAHHDHLGVLPRGDGDRINNGANDDASGVATVLAMAEAFAARSPRPKRTLVFMTYFGEEKGLLGSKYYARHPAIRLSETVANLNFEQMGRTDDAEGARVAKLTGTGLDYTSIWQVLTESSQEAGVGISIHEKNNDLFFAASDNQPLADMGVPAITLSVTFIFPDYHRPGDHWEKIDYANFELVVRAAALTVSRLADAKEPVKWSPENPKVEKYRKAYQALHP